MNFHTKFKKLPTLSQQDHIILNEIVNLKRTTMDSGDDQLDPDHVKVVRSGAFGGGSVDVNDPHIFNKTTYEAKANLKEDPYYQYVKYASKYVKSNPFFPRVYNVNTTNFNDGKRPTYKIESLTHIQELNNSQIVAVGRTISKQLRKRLYDFYNDFQQIPNTRSDQTDNHLDDDYRVKQIMITVITKELQKIFQNDTQSNTDVNPKLLQVVKLIDFLKNKYDYEYDISANNYMIRLSPIGPQIVITDPLVG